MIILKAPFPTYTHTLVLPNPTLGDSNTVIRSVDIKRSIDNTSYSYVRTSEFVRLLYNINMTRLKAMELVDFTKLHRGTRWHLTDYNDDTYIVSLKSPTLALRNFRRSVYKNLSLSPPVNAEEAVTIDLEFDGEIINS